MKNCIKTNRIVKRKSKKPDSTITIEQYMRNDCFRLGKPIKKSPSANVEILLFPTEKGNLRGYMPSREKPKALQIACSEDKKKGVTTSEE
jgi:hypothetical protein